VREIAHKTQDKYAEVFGIKAKGPWRKLSLMKVAKEMRSEPVKIEYKGITGEAKTTEIFTQEKLGYAYMLFQNEDLHEQLSKIDPKESMGGMIKYDPETDTFEKTDLANQIEKNLDPKMKEWAEYLGDLLSNELYDRYNETYKKFFAFDMPRNRMYMPLFRETDDTAKMGIDELLERETLSSMGYNRHLYQRKPNNHPIKIMPITDVFMSYVNKMERFHNKAGTLQEMKRLFHNPSVINALKENYGNYYVKVINQFLDRYAGLPTGKVMPYVDKVRRMLTRATLGLKPVIMIKQFTSFPAYSMFVPHGQMAIGFKEFFRTGAAKNWKMLQNSSYILNRYDAGFDRDIADSMTREYKSKSPSIDNFMNWTMFMIKFGDKVPIILGGFSVYNYNYKEFRKQGQSHEDAHKNAIREFELATRFTQQASDVGDLGYWQSENSFTKLGTMYMTAPLAYQRATSSGVRMALSGFKGKNWKIFRKGVKTAFVGHVLLPTIFQFIANGCELDDEEERRDLVWAAILGNLNNLFAIGDAVNYVIDHAVRERPWSYQGTPVEAIAIDTERAVKEIISVIEDISEGKDLPLDEYLETIDRISKPMAYLTGVPWPGFYRSAEGIIQAIEHDEATVAKKVKWITGWSKKGLERTDTEDEGPTYE
jgi:hypothetical protein